MRVGVIRLVPITSCCPGSIILMWWTVTHIKWKECLTQRTRCFEMPLSKKHASNIPNNIGVLLWKLLRDSGTFGAHGNRSELWTHSGAAEAKRLLRYRSFNLFSQDAVIDRSQTLLFWWTHILVPGTFPEALSVARLYDDNCKVILDCVWSLCSNVKLNFLLASRLAICN